MVDGPDFESRHKARLFLAAQAVGGLFSVAGGIWFLSQEDPAGPQQDVGGDLYAGLVGRPPTS